jgi:dTDP-glucose pyrophosphorylase/predicted transcriptional regulator
MSANWQNTILNPQSSIIEAIEKLNEFGFGIILVSNEKKKLIGTVTDGDIRRALIKHTPFNTAIEHIMNQKPYTANYKKLNEELLEILSKNNILQIPLIDENNELVGLKSLNNLLEKNKYSNPVFIMAGGFGKRLKPLTTKTPKPMLEVGGEPILEKTIKQFINSGFYNFYISTFYKSKVIKDYFQDGANWNISIKYIDEPKPLGTAGALSLLPYKKFNSPIIMINGDLITDLNIKNLLSYHNEQENMITIGAKKYDIHVPYGVIETVDYKVKSIVEKPTHYFFINAGIYVINPKIIDNLLINKKIDMPYWITKLIEKNININIFPIHEYWLDIGERSQYEEAKLKN